MTNPEKKKFRKIFGIIAVLSLMFVLVLMVSTQASDTETVEEICDDGIDNDGDGKVDGLYFLDPENGETKRLATNNPFPLVGFVKEKTGQSFSCPLGGGSAMMRSFNGGWGTLRSDQLHPTAEKICNLGGYRDAKSAGCYWPVEKLCNFYSPENDCLWYWDESSSKFKYSIGVPKYSKSWISNLVCKNRLPQCSNGIDDDNDGEIDYPNDDGCVSPYDDNEEKHDPDCEVCFYDSDCGTDGFIGDASCQGDDLYQDYETFECLNSGTNDAECSSTTEPRLIEECDFKCVDDECVGECSEDDDCHDDYYSEDYCDGKEVVRDFHDFSCDEQGSCNEKVTTFVVKECDERCFEGKCVDDGECEDDGDCDDDYYSDKYCDGKRVVKDFHDFFCSDCGECEEDVTTIIVEECDERCFEGKCVDNGECEDDCDCPEGYYGGNYCDGKEVVRDLYYYVCEDGKCEKKTTTESLVECDYKCRNGRCRNKVIRLEPKFELFEESIKGQVSNAINLTGLQVDQPAIELEPTEEKTPANLWWLLIILVIAVIILIILIIIVFSS
jgi:hypothetical protein